MTPREARACLKRSGLTQNMFARAIGCEQGHLSRMITGKQKIAKYMARAIKHTVEEIEREKQNEKN